MVTAIARRTVLDIGAAIAVVSVSLVIGARVIGGRLGAATIATAVLLGPAVDGWLALIGRFPEPVGAGGWALLLAGIVLIATGGAVQISSGWGPSPLDALCVAIAGHRWSLRRVRTGVELSFAAGGGLAGGALGAGTLVVAVGVGPVLAVAMSLLRPVRRTLAVEP
jgi:uncharacterized membrane protein YczE